MLSVLIKTTKDFALDPEIVERKAKEILSRYFEKREKVELSVIFVDEIESHRFNLRLRKKDELASILTFSLQEQTGQAPPEAGQAFKFDSSPDGVLRLGDIVICPAVMNRQGLTLEEILEHGIKSLFSRIPTTTNQRFRDQRNP